MGPPTPHDEGPLGCAPRTRSEGVPDARSYFCHNLHSSGEAFVASARLHEPSSARTLLAQMRTRVGRRLQ